MGILTKMLDLFKAPDPVTTAPPSVTVVKRERLNKEPLTLLQSIEFRCAIHNYNLYTDDWLPHHRKLEYMTAVYISEDSSKWFQKALIDIEYDSKYYRLETFIKRYQKDIRSVTEITKRQFNKPNVLVFSKELMKLKDTI